MLNLDFIRQKYFEIGIIFFVDKYGIEIEIAIGCFTVVFYWRRLK